MTLTPIDYFLMIMAVVSSSVWGLWIGRHRHVWLYGVPPLSLCVNVLLYYITFRWHTPWVHTFWFNTIMFQSALLLTGISIVMLAERLIVNESR